LVIKEFQEDVDGDPDAQIKKLAQSIKLTNDDDNDKKSLYV